MLTRLIKKLKQFWAFVLSVFKSIRVDGVESRRGPDGEAQYRIVIGCSLLLSGQIRSAWVSADEAKSIYKKIAA